jgi:hypothetical protein
MPQALITERYADEIAGVLHCYDRIVISGQLGSICYAKGMTKYLYAQGIRIFDYPKTFADPLRNTIRENAIVLAESAGLEIEFITKYKSFRKEERIQTILEERGCQPGLVHIFSAMESCQAYEPWHDKAIKKTYVRMKQNKCLHYYFYFMDEMLGLCYLRVPTWCPFRLQFYCNGHNILANQLRSQQIDFEMADNAFLTIADFAQANALAKSLTVEALHARLDAYAATYCPAAATLQMGYNWSIMQAEYATDIIFRNQTALQAFYPHLVETLIQAVKPADIATFLGRKLHSNYQDEMGNRFNRRWLGTRIKHTMGPVTLKIYDKFSLVLRIETTVNDVAFFDHYRQVQHRDGTTSTRYAPMKKTIYSLPPLAETLYAVHLRYLKFISDIDTPDGGADNLYHLAETEIVENRRYKGFNLLSEEDSSLFRTLASGEFTINGFSNRTLRQHLPTLNSGQVTRLLKRLHVHGLIKRVGKHYRYYLADLGRRTITLALKLREIVVIPALANP